MIGFAPASNDYTYAASSSSRNNEIIVVVAGMLCISVVTSLIGAMMGLKCKSTSCCISRHFLKRWCNMRSAYRHSRYRQRRNRCRCMRKRYCLRECFESKSVNSTGCELPAPLPQNRCRPCCRSAVATSSLSTTSSTAVAALSTSSVQTRVRDSGSSTSPSFENNVYDGEFAILDSTIQLGGKFSNSQTISQSGVKILQSGVKISQSDVKITQTGFNTPQTIVEENTQNTEMVSTSTNRSRGNVMLRLARMQDWENLVRRCSTHPNEARKIDSDGLIPLHWACSSGPPLYAVEALLKAYPASAREVDLDGSTALHFLIFYGVPNLAVLHLLWSHNPKAVNTRDVHGRTPLYHACNKGVSIEVLQQLLLYEPRAVTIPRFNGTRTPLSMTWKAALRKNNLTGTFVGGKKGKEWDKAMLLLEVAYTGALPSNDIENIPPMEGPKGRKLWNVARDRPRRTFRMLHASIAVPECPPEVFEVAVKMNPHQAKERDDDGRLPLHVAAAAFSRGEGRASSLGKPSLYRNVIRTLTSLFPEAARTPDHDGRLPIFLALESGKFLDDGVRDILQCYMDVLFMKDSKTGLYPFMLAAACATTSSTLHKKKVLPASSRRMRSFAAGPVFSLTREFERVSTVNNSQEANLLSEKEGERLRIVGRGSESTSSGLYNNNATNPAQMDADVRQVETIYELLRLSPGGVRMG